MPVGPPAPKMTEAPSPMNCIGRRRAAIGGDEAVDVDAEQVQIGIDVTRALLKAVAEFLDRRDIDAVDAGDGIGADRISDLRCQDASQETRLIFAELNPDIVGRTVHDELVDAQEMDSRIGFGRRPRRCYPRLGNPR